MCEEPSNALNQVPWVQSFVAKNDSSCLIQTRFVGEMSQCGITSFRSFEMFGVIKSVLVPHGVLHKHNDYRINVHVKCLLPPRHRSEFQNSKLCATLNVNLHPVWGFLRRKKLICDLWHFQNYTYRPRRLLQQKVIIFSALLYYSLLISAFHPWPLLRFPVSA